MEVRLRRVFSTEAVRQHEIAVQHRLPFATPYCTTQNQMPRDWRDVAGRSTTYGFCPILDMCHVNRFPVHDHMSLPLHQYSYCADLFLARMFALSDFEFWLTFTRSFKNLQAWSITCVPACLRLDLPATRQLVCLHGHILWKLPNRFAIDFPLLLLVDDCVVQNPKDLGLVTPGNRFAIGFHSALRIAPGPGARHFVI